MSDKPVDVVDQRSNVEDVEKEIRENESDIVEEEEEDEDEQCGFCIFMKGGGCKKEFVVNSPFPNSLKV
jgi:hypothetical protein